MTLQIRERAVRPSRFHAPNTARTASWVLLRDRWLSREVEQREQRMMAEFPTIVELLALAVAAGAGAVGALERATRISELARELARALADARAGASLVLALQGLAGSEVAHGHARLAHAALPPRYRYSSR